MVHEHQINAFQPTYKIYSYMHDKNEILLYAVNIRSEIIFIECKLAITKENQIPHNWRKLRLLSSFNADFAAQNVQIWECYL